MNRQIANQLENAKRIDLLPASRRDSRLASIERSLLFFHQLIIILVRTFNIRKMA